MWKLYRNRAHTRIKLCAELASTSKSITLLIMKVPGAPSNYHVRTDGSTLVIRITGTMWKPELLFKWARLTLTDRLSGLNYDPLTTAKFNRLYAKRVRSILEAPHCLSIKFINGVEVRPIQQVCGPTCEGVDCREVFGDNPFRRTLYHLNTCMKPSIWLEPAQVWGKGCLYKAIPLSPTPPLRFPLDLPANCEETIDAAVA